MRDLIRLIAKNSNDYDEKYIKSEFNSHDEFMTFHGKLQRMQKHCVLG